MDSSFELQCEAAWLWFVIYFFFFTIMQFSNLILPSIRRRNVPGIQLLPLGSKFTVHCLLGILKHFSLASWHDMSLSLHIDMRGAWRRKALVVCFHFSCSCLPPPWAGSQDVQGNSALESSAAPPAGFLKVSSLPAGLCP